MNMLNLLVRKKAPHNNVEKENIVNSVNRAKIELDIAYKNFDDVSDVDLVDCYIYEVQSIQKKYEYLLKQAKKLNFI
ncbi:MAG: hypothetical protein A2Y24_06570 [Clostridiales bacterium GWE2_32_10]|nr:MAG: hypothetical protein A2Y24_06570 [Clostridiales bacterium GWE2_32_10]HBY20393.1 DUF2508 domain-containing protein [Clostridiales bacterium]